MEAETVSYDLGGCPADAAKEVVDLATFVSVQKGGNGAVREFIEWLLNSTPSFLR